MNTKTKRMICLLVGIASVLTIVGTVSYAYFTALGEMRKQEASISTGTARATFRDGDTGITGVLSFGESITKKFTIENTGTVEANVKMYFKDLINTYGVGSLTYTLLQAETEDGTYTEVVSKTNVPKNEENPEEPITVSLSEVLTISVGETRYYNLVITLNYLADVNQDADINAKFSSSFDLKDVNYKEETTSSGSTLIAKANDVSVTSYSAGNQQEMYAFDHEIMSTDTNSNSYTASQIENWTTEERRDYRYIGSNPNNYITFNDETWRIIGVFTVETEDGNKEQLMKIIRNESIGNLAWDSSNVNEWSTSSLKTLLNGDYYNQSGGYTNSASVKGLSETARNQVANVKWYLGGSSTYEGLGGPNYYSFERGETVYSGRSTNIVAKVGLMYPSDYVYTYGKGVNEKCYTDGYNCKTDGGGTPSAGWLFNSAYQWTISPRADSSIYAFSVDSAGYGYGYNGNSTIGVRPSVYLKSNIQIKSGTGASNDPYVLG